jgi:hypothetical protein
MKTCPTLCRAQIATVLPLRSRTARMRWGPEQLEAAHANSRQEDDGILRVDAQEKRPTH